MRSIIVGSSDLEFDPCSWQLRSALDAPFKGCWQAYEQGAVGIDLNRRVWMIKIRACGTVTIPVVVVEGVGLLAAGVIVQNDSWAGGRSIASMCLHEFGLGLFELRDSGSYKVIVRIDE